jgi:hypothetical protein
MTESPTGSATAPAPPKTTVSEVPDSVLLPVVGWIWLFFAITTPVLVAAMLAVASQRVSPTGFTVLEQGGIISVFIFYGPLSFLWAAWIGYHRAKGWLLTSFVVAPLGVVVLTGICMAAFSSSRPSEIGTGGWLPFYIGGAIFGSIFFLGALGVGAMTGSYAAGKRDE